MSLYVIGVDGGASKTRCFVASLNGDVMAEGLGGCANKNVTSWEDAVLQVRLAVMDALVKGEVLPSQIAAAHYGLGGVSSDACITRWKEAVNNLSPNGVISVENDVFLAVHAVDCREGIGVVSGSGGNIGAISKGKAFHVNGRVPFNSSQLGRRALEELMNLIQKKERLDRFGEAVVNLAGLDEAQFFKEVYLSLDGAAARIAPIVVELSNQENLEARSMVLDWLAGVNRSIQHFQVTNELHSFPICFGGATFSSMGSLILEHMETSSEILVSPIPLAAGAVKAAIRKLGV